MEARAAANTEAAQLAAAACRRRYLQKRHMRFEYAETKEEVRAEIQAAIDNGTLQPRTRLQSATGNAGTRKSSSTTAPTAAAASAGHAAPSPEPSQPPQPAAAAPPPILSGGLDEAARLAAWAQAQGVPASVAPASSQGGVAAPRAASAAEAATAADAWLQVGPPQPLLHWRGL